jgi:ferric-dicitrate binding protein FerR (iron transport regulator)
LTARSANHKPLPELDIDTGEIPTIVARAMQLPGVSETTARNMGGWLVVVHAGLTDRASDRAKAKWRRILAELADVGAMPDPPSPQRRAAQARRREAGRASIATLAVTGGAAGLVATGAWEAAVALGAVYITYNGADPDSPAPVGAVEGSIVRIESASRRPQRAPAARLAA